MIWIDEFLYTNESEGLAQTTLKQDQLYFDKGVFYPSAYIELIAQAYAYTQAIIGREKNQILNGCYLTNIDRMENSNASLLLPGDTLVISVKTVRNLHPAYVLEGKIFDLQGNKLCDARLKGFAFFDDELNQLNKQELRA